uniref:Uncharacterized protein n=1 Tax=Arundo donax TaxID=35708 RepID=A0A0A9DDQ6_ARUDO
MPQGKWRAWRSA